MHDKRQQLIQQILGNTKKQQNILLPSFHGQILNCLILMDFVHRILDNSTNLFMSMSTPQKYFAASIINISYLFLGVGFFVVD